MSDELTTELREFFDANYPNMRDPAEGPAMTEVARRVRAIMDCFEFNEEELADLGTAIAAIEKAVHEYERGKAEAL
jgi:hypothetical protein